MDRNFLMGQKLTGLFAGRSGTAMLEFAMALPFVVILFLGVIELGGYIWQAVEVNSATEASLLYATKNGWCSGTCSTNTGSQIANSAANAGISDTTAVSPSCYYGCPGSGSPFAITAMTGRCGIDTPPACGDGYPARQYVSFGASLSRTSFVTGGSGLLNLTLPGTVSGTAIVRVK